MAEITGAMSARERNARLWQVLRAIREAPDSDALKEDWAYATIDLTRAVFTTQFASLRDSAEREDLEQSALLEFHRGVVKLSIFTDYVSPETLFRILYSVAKFSMLRELTRLKRHLPQDLVHEVETARMVRIENLPDEDDANHPTIPGPDVAMDEQDRERFVAVQLPRQIEAAIDRHNLYAKTQWCDPIRFVTMQRLKGKFVSVSFVRAYWKTPDPELVVSYSDYLARTVVLALATTHARTRQVAFA